MRTVLDASLALAGGSQDLRTSLDAPSRIRVAALAADTLAEHDLSRAAVLDFLDP